MGTAHANYQPTEYEEMLIAAKWLSIEDVDTAYQEYVHGNSDAVRYNTWLSMRREWDELNARYGSEVEPHYSAYSEITTIPFHIQQLGDQLLREMSDLEIMLGY